MKPVKKKSNIIFLEKYLKSRRGEGASDEGPEESVWESPARPSPNLRDINERDGHGNTALHFAAQSGRKEKALSLIRAGAEVNAQNKDGNTPLHFVFVLPDMPEGESPKSQKRDSEKIRAEITAALVKAGAEVNMANENVETPLHLAAIYGNGPAARTLIEKGSKINVKTIDGKTPRDYALGVNCAELVSILDAARGLQESGPAENAGGRLSGGSRDGPGKLEAGKFEAGEFEKTALEENPPLNIIYMEGFQKKRARAGGGSGLSGQAAKNKPSGQSGGKDSAGAEPAQAGRAPGGLSSGPGLQGGQENSRQPAEEDKAGGGPIFMRDYLKTKRPPEELRPLHEGDILEDGKRPSNVIPFPRPTNPPPPAPPGRDWGWRAAAAVAVMVAAVLVFRISEPQGGDGNRGPAAVKESPPAVKKAPPPTEILTGRAPTKKEELEFEKTEPPQREPQSFRGGRKSLSASEYVRLISKGQLLHQKAKKPSRSGT